MHFYKKQYLNKVFIAIALICPLFFSSCLADVLNEKLKYTVPEHLVPPEEIKVNPNDTNSYEYDIIIKTNGGSLNSYIETVQTKVENEEYFIHISDSRDALPINVYEFIVIRSGYDFFGWYLNDEQVYQIIPSQYKKDFVIEARWEENGEEFGDLEVIVN